MRDGGPRCDGACGFSGRSSASPWGEAEAIRDACARLGTLDLSGCELFSSCEPCALCVAAMAIAGIGRVVYAASLADSDAALGRDPGVVVALRRTAGTTGGSMTARPELRAEAVAVLEGVGGRSPR